MLLKDGLLLNLLRFNGDRCGLKNKCITQRNSLVLRLDLHPLTSLKSPIEYFGSQCTVVPACGSDLNCVQTLKSRQRNGGLKNWSIRSSYFNLRKAALNWK